LTINVKPKDVEKELRKYAVLLRRIVIRFAPPLNRVLRKTARDLTLPEVLDKGFRAYRMGVERDGLQTVFTQLMSTTSALAGERVFEQDLVAAEQLRVARNIFLEKQLEIANRQASRLADLVSENTDDFISRSVFTAENAGKQGKVILDYVRQKVNSNAPARAESLTRTQAHIQAQRATDDAAQELGLDIKTKTWWTARDDRVRLTHRALNKVTVPYTELFSVGESKLAFPGDVNHGASDSEIYNCRCIVTYDLA
jgi:hypothetical protein